MKTEDKTQDLPSWAKAIIGILQALVTMILALGVNIGEILKTRSESMARIEERKLDYENTQKTQQELTKLLAQSNENLAKSSNKVIQFPNKKQLK